VDPCRDEVLNSERLCRKVIPLRSGGFCERCGRGGGLSLHHRKKRGQGGAWSPDNIVHVCGHGTIGCHGWIEHNPDAAAAEGWHVRPWQIPGDTPVWQHHLRKWTRFTVEVTPYDQVIDTQDPWFPEELDYL
jgi:hypothetical protein